MSALKSAKTPKAAVVADDPPAAGSVSPGKEDGAAEADERPTPEGEEGGDSLWLSSIMSDQEEKEAE